MSTKTICMICEEPVNIWTQHLVTDAYQKNGINHYEFECPDCGITQNKEIPLQDKPAVMSYDSLMTAFKTLIFG